MPFLPLLFMLVMPLNWVLLRVNDDAFELGAAPGQLMRSTGFGTASFSSSPSGASTPNTDGGSTPATSRPTGKRSTESIEYESNQQQLYQ